MIQWFLLILIGVGLNQVMGTELAEAFENQLSMPDVQTNELNSATLLLGPPPLQPGIMEQKKRKTSAIQVEIERGATVIGSLNSAKSTNIVAAKSTNVVAAKSTNVVAAKSTNVVAAKSTNVVAAGALKFGTNNILARPTNAVARLESIIPKQTTNVIEPSIQAKPVDAQAGQAKEALKSQPSKQIETVAHPQPVQDNSASSQSKPVLEKNVQPPITTVEKSKPEDPPNKKETISLLQPTHQGEAASQAKTEAHPGLSGDHPQSEEIKKGDPVLQEEPTKQNEASKENEVDNHNLPAAGAYSHSKDLEEQQAAPEEHSSASSYATNQMRLDLEGPASPNLLNPSNHVSGEKVYEVQLVLAQKLHLEKNNSQAVKTLTSLLESKASDTIKKTALLEMAQIYQENNDLLRAQQVYSQFCQRYPQDPRLPVIFLKIGILYREMGSPNLAIGKFYSVMTTAINLKTEHLEEYRRLVLHAQTEIADTYYYQGKYAEASDLFKRLLREDTPLLNRPLVQFKLLRSLHNQRNFVELQAFGQDFLNRFPTSSEQPEVRFLLATAYKQLGRNRESLEQVLLLLQSQSQLANINPASWAYWQQRTGNEIANQLYQEADFHNALEIYQGLLKIDSSASWQIPVLYQIGLVYERLNQSPKAIEIYQHILKRQKELRNPPPANMQSIMDMAKWRTNYLGWSVKVDGVQQSMLSLPGARSTATNIP